MTFIVAGTSKTLIVETPPWPCALHRRASARSGAYQMSAFVRFLLGRERTSVTIAATHAAPAADPFRWKEPATPLVTLDLARVGWAHRVLRRALPEVALHYAVKANPDPAVLATLAAQGCRWDVASPAELEAVLAVDPDPEHVSYGNTVKKSVDIAAAYSVGVRRFSFDCAAELDKLTGCAPGATLLVRLATSGKGADWALARKFGCSEEVAERLLVTAARRGHRVGVCFHVGSQQREVDAWDAPLAMVGRLRARLRHSGVDLAVVDLGGGFPAAGVAPAAPPLHAVGGSITAALSRHLVDDVPELMAEPGRCLVADAGMLETEVVLVSHRSRERWVYLDVGLFSGLAETMGEAVRYRITAVRDGAPLAGPTGPAVLAGPTCDSADILYAEQRPLLPLGLRAGDRLLMHGAGAYTTSYSSVGFNGFPPLRAVCP